MVIFKKVTVTRKPDTREIMSINESIYQLIKEGTQIIEMLGFLFVINEKYITEQSNKYVNNVLINHNVINTLGE